jgi:ABC-type transport system involved in multi-copper enzyme maturation permease subunit
MMSDFTALFLKELKRFNGPRNLAVWLIFLVIVLVFVNTGVNDYKKVPEKEEKFKTIQFNYFKNTPNYVGYGRDGIKIVFIPSPTEVLFQNTVVPPDLAAKIDNIVSVNIGNNLKGKSLSPSGIGGRLDFSNLVLLLGSIFALFFGYESLYHKEYLKFLSSLRSHRKTFAAIVISRSILFIAAFLFLFFFVLLFLAVAGIGFSAANYATLAGFLVSKLGMLLFFFMVGVFFGTFRSVLFSAVSMFVAWFLLVFIIPGLINAAVGKKIPDIILAYQTELNKFKITIDFENKTEKKMGKFSRGNIEAERQNIEEFKKVDYKEMENLEKALRDEIAAAIHTYYTLSAWTPVTFYQCTGNEISSRGYESFLDFHKYAVDLKRDFVWFFIQRVFYNDPEVMVSFIKKDENIYRASSQLPVNFVKGLLINLLLIILLFMISLFRCENALFPSPEKANAYDDLDLGLETGNQYTYNVYYPEAVHQFVNAFFGGGKRLNWKIAIDDEKGRFFVSTQRQYPARGP